MKVRIAGGLLWVSGIGLGIPCLICLRSLSQGRGIPLVFGYPAYGGGGFDGIGIRTTAALVSAFLGLCILEVSTGWLLLGKRRAGAAAAMALLVPEAIFWWGFSLPYPPILALARTMLIAAGKEELT
ncbi:MAG: hypothetical protein H0U16_00850 [Actinobacteria bacterium]|nr:hypothetical protein [Actinomycetota bacterium]